MNQLNETDTSRVNAAFDEGCKNVSQKDLDEVLNRTEEFNKKASKLGDMLDNATLLFRMLKDYKGGKYTDVPWALISAIVFAVIYFFSPIDVVPDVIPVIGYVDDATVFALLIKTFGDQVAAYKKWCASASFPPAEKK